MNQYSQGPRDYGINGFSFLHNVSGLPTPHSEIFILNILTFRANLEFDNGLKWHFKIMGQEAVIYTAHIAHCVAATFDELLDLQTYRLWFHDRGLIHCCSQFHLYFISFALSSQFSIESPKTKIRFF